MDWRDQELLDKQMRSLNLPQRHDGLVIMAILAVFLGGMIAGSWLGETNEPQRMAFNEPSLAGAPANGSAIAPIAR